MTTEFDTRFGDMIGNIESLPTIVTYPVYVPSRKRSHVLKTTKLLKTSNVDFYIVVEPQDADEYLKHYDQSTVLVMDENDRGVAYVRNFCKQHAKSIHAKYHWQIDDNINNFYIRKNNKNNKVAINIALSLIEEFIDPYVNIGICSPRHVMFSATIGDDVAIALNKQVYSCVLVNNAVDIHWRNGCVEDTDYSLQVLSANYCSILFQKIIMQKVATGALTGGNTEMYNTDDGRLLRNQGLQQNWPGVFDCVWNGTRYKILPSRVWRQFRQIPITADSTNLESFMTEKS